MMKNVIYVLLFYLCLSFAACNSSSAISVDSKANSTPPLPQAENSNQNKEKQVKTLEVDPKYPLVLLGSVELKESKVVVNENRVWTDGRDGRDISDAKESDFLRVEKGDQIEVDIMNCAGFIAKGKAKELDDYGWELKLLTDTLAADAAEKVKQCVPPSYSPDEGILISDVFALAPARDARRNIKTAKIDPKKLFTSLPNETRVWADKSEEGNRKKGILTLANDNWADVDGDGQFDLVIIFGDCESKEYTCGSLLWLIEGKWKEIGYFVPA